MRMMAKCTKNTKINPVPCILEVAKAVTENGVGKTEPLGRNGGLD